MKKLFNVLQYLLLGIALVGAQAVFASPPVNAGKIGGAAPNAPQTSIVGGAASGAPTTKKVTPKSNSK